MDVPLSFYRREFDALDLCCSSTEPADQTHGAGSNAEAPPEGTWDGWGDANRQHGQAGGLGAEAKEDENSREKDLQHAKLYDRWLKSQMESDKAIAALSEYESRA